MRRCSFRWRRNGLCCGHRVGRPARLRAGGRALGRAAGAAALRARLRGRSRSGGRGRGHVLRVWHSSGDLRRLGSGSRNSRGGNRSRLGWRRRWNGRRRGGRRRSRRLSLGGGRGRRRGCGRRAGCTPRRKQSERVDVRLFGADPHSQVDIRHVVLGVARWAGSGDRISLGHAIAFPDLQRAEVGERRLVVARHDRHGEAVRRHLAGEHDLAGDRGANRGVSAEGDVDPTMLATGVLVVHHREPAQDGTIGGPRPREGRRPGSQRPDECRPDAECPSRCPVSEHEATVARARRRGNAV